MKRRPMFLKCWLLLLGFACCDVLAQNIKFIDSLNSVIKWTVNDEVRANAYTKISTHYSEFSLFEEALGYAAKAVFTAQKTSNANLKKGCIENLEKIYSGGSKSSACFKIYRSAVDELPPDTLKVETMVNLINQDDPWHSERLNYAEQTLILSRKLTFIRGEMDVHGFYLRYYTEKAANVEKALYHAGRTMELSKKAHHVRNEINALVMISEIYEGEKMFRQAVSSLVNGMDLAIKHRDTLMSFIICMNVARNYNGLALEPDDGKDSVKFWKRANVYLDSSIIYSKNALDIIKTLRPESELLQDASKELLAAMIEQGMGMYYMNKGEVETARRYMKSAALVMEESHSTAFSDSTLNTVADGAMMYYYVTDNNTDSAIYYNNKMLKSAHNQADLYILLSDLAKLNFKKGDYQSAYNNLARAEVLKDSIHQLKRSATSKDLLIKYETAEKEKSIVELQKTNLLRESELTGNRAMNTGITVLILILLLCLIFIWYYSADTRKKQQLLLEKKQATELLERQESERQRIAGELHDHLGSMLTTVKLYFGAVEDDIEQLKRVNKEYYERAHGLLDDACREVRKLAHNLGSGMLIKLGLLSALSDLKEAAEKSGAVRMQVLAFGMEKRLPVEVELNLFRIIQELVNNTLQHAKADTINLQLNLIENELNILFEDNGVGFDPKNINSQGFGFRNIRERVVLLHGTFVVDSHPGHGTACILDIPVIRNQTL